MAPQPGNFNLEQRSARSPAQAALPSSENAVAIPTDTSDGVQPPPVAGGLSSVATAERVPVESASTTVIGSASHVLEAFGLLREALLRAQADSHRAHYNSGLLRLEVALPRGTDPLAWLRALPSADPSLMPQAFFAPRAIPPVPSGDLSELSLDSPPTRGAGDGAAMVSVAGAGAGRLWRAPTGCAFDADACARLRRFVANGAPRTRVLGGMRFDTARPASPDWEPFGGYFLMLPLLELSEGAHASVMAVTVAWDKGAVSPPHEHETGFASFPEAISAALAAVGVAAQSAASRGAALAHADTKLGASVASRTHLPDEAGWTDSVTDLLLELGRSAQADDSPVVGAAAMEALERLAASNGGEVAQQVLSGSASASATAAAASSIASASRATAAADGRVRGGAAFAALGDLARSASGRKALEELAGRSGGTADLAEELQDVARAGRRSAQLATLESLASGRAYVEASEPVPLEALMGGSEMDALVERLGAGAGVGMQSGIAAGGGKDAAADSEAAAAEAAAAAMENDAQELREGVSGPLTKVVMARRTELDLSADLDPFTLIAALRRRNPGAYSFALCLPGGAGSFVGATPERLFAIENGTLATEAVAGTRGRGADESEDAALAYDLLTCPKEHAEFTIVQDWCGCPPIFLAALGLPARLAAVHSSDDRTSFSVTFPACAYWPTNPRVMIFPPPLHSHPLLSPRQGRFLPAPRVPPRLSRSRDGEDRPAQRPCAAPLLAPLRRPRPRNDRGGRAGGAAPDPGGVRRSASASARGGGGAGAF